MGTNNGSDGLSNSQSLRERNKMLKSSGRRSVSVLNLDSSDKTLDETLFSVLMKDPIKRPIILKMLQEERENFIKYKESQNKEERAKQKQLKKTQQLLHCESPTALLRRRALMKIDSESDSSSNVSQSQKSDSPKIKFDSLLEGVCAYVEIQSKGVDCSEGARAKAEAMGATVLDSLTKKVTHVIFKDGSFSTYQKAKLMKIHLVSILWLKAVETTQSRVPEKNFPALGTELYDNNITQICQEYEEAVRDEYKRSLSLRHKNNRQTGLPSELKSQCLAIDSEPVESFHLQEDLNNLDNLPTNSRLSRNVIPSSQSWEAESIISCPGGTLPIKRTLFTNTEQECLNSTVSCPELTSDDDSNCSVVNEHSIKPGQPVVCNFNLSEDNQEVRKKSSISSSSSSLNCSASLLYRKPRTSKVLKHDNLSVVNMDLTTNVVTTNLQTREIVNRRKSLRIEENSKSTLINKRHTFSSTDVVSKKRKIYTKNDANELVTKNSSLVSKITPRKELYVKLIREHSSPTIALPAVSEGLKEICSKDIPSPISISDCSKKDSLQSESMPSLRLSYSSNSNNNSYKNKSSSVRESERCPSLRLPKSNLEMSNTAVKILDNTRLDNPNDKERNETQTKIPEGRSDDLLSLRFSRKSNNSKKMSDSDSTTPSILDKHTSASSEDMPSLRISISNSEAIDLEKSPLTNEKHENLEKSKSETPNNKTEKDRKKRVYRKLYNLNDPVDQFENEVVDSRVVNKTVAVPNNNKESSEKPHISLEPLLFTQNVINMLKTTVKKTKSKMPEVDKNAKRSKQMKNVKRNQTNSGTSKKQTLQTPVKKIVSPPLKPSTNVVRRSMRVQSLHESKTDKLPITPQLNRRSSLDFVQTPLPRSPNIFTQKSKKRKSIIVCTRMHRPEVQTFMQIVKNLKGFVINNEVSKKTTHLVVGDCKRTINLLRAIAYGCWIVTKEWLYRSLEAGKWLEEENFELTDFSVAVRQCRMQRQAFGSLYKMDVFSNCGSIYVSRNSTPRHSDLEELIQLGGGTITQLARSANVVVGTWVRYENVKCVRETWVLDCITFNKRKSFKNHLLLAD